MATGSDVKMETSESKTGQETDLKESNTGTVAINSDSEKILKAMENGNVENHVNSAFIGTCGEEKMENVDLDDVILQEQSEKKGTSFEKSAIISDEVRVDIKADDSESSNYGLTETAAHVIRLVLCLLCGLSFGFLAVKGQGNMENPTFFHFYVMTRQND